MKKQKTKQNKQTNKKRKSIKLPQISTICWSTTKKYDVQVYA